VYTGNLVFIGVRLIEFQVIFDFCMVNKQWTINDSNTNTCSS
jgi:hypothetical protein